MRVINKEFVFNKNTASLSKNFKTDYLDKNEIYTLGQLSRGIKFLNYEVVEKNNSRTEMLQGERNLMPITLQTLIKVSTS